MKFFIDNNLSKRLANGMAAFGEEVVHIKDLFPDNPPDVEWLQYIGENNYFLITRDIRIRYNPLELQALRRNKVGAFFMGGKQRTRCQLIQQLIRNWPRIKDYARRTHKPFAYRIRPTGTTLDKINI